MEGSLTNIPTNIDKSLRLYLQTISTRIDGLYGLRGEDIITDVDNNLNDKIEKNKISININKNSILNNTTSIDINKNNISNNKISIDTNNNNIENIIHNDISFTGIKIFNNIIKLSTNSYIPSSDNIETIQTNYSILVNATEDGQQVNLPNALIGINLIIYNNSGYSVTINCQSDDTIDGNTSYSLDNNSILNIISFENKKWKII